MFSAEFNSGLFGGELQQRDIARHDQITAGMPAGAVEDEHSVRAWCDRGADLGEVNVHRACIGIGHNEPGAEGTRWTDRAEKIGPAVAAIARRTRPRALLCPYAPERTLLTDSGFILHPDLERLGAGVVRQRSFDLIGKAFFHAVWAAGSLLGCLGRTESLA